tara:strand:+ start:3598 stop:4977 length:1380 start_codon:yes stop_codon:yes gene_type:complete
MPNQIPSLLPGGPVHSPISMGFISYYKQSASVEQWYPTQPLGFGYHNSTTLKVFYPGATDVNAVDEVRITLATGTSHTDAAEWIMLAQTYGQLHPTSESIKRIVVTGGQSMRPEFISCTITYGTCCSGGGGTMSYWLLDDTNGNSKQIDNTENVIFADSTFINNVVSSTRTVTTSLSATGTPNTSTFLRGDNTWSSPPNTTYSKATNSALGLVKLEDVAVQSTAANAITTTASRTYGLQFNASDQLVVNVPWTDTGGDTFKTMVPISGTSPVAAGNDTLNFTSLQSGGAAGIASGTGGVAIAGNSTTDTLNILARRFESFVITMTDEFRPVTTGVKYIFRIPYNFTISWYGGVISGACSGPVRIMVNTPPSSGEGVGLTVNVETSTNNGGSWSPLFGVKPTIDVNEFSSVTAAARVELVSDVIATSITCDTLLRFTVDSVLGTPVGLKCILVGYQSTIA